MIATIATYVALALSIPLVFALWKAPAIQERKIEARVEHRKK